MRLRPDLSLTMCVGTPNGGPEDAQSFLVDPFKVQEILGSRNIQISSGGVAIAPLNESPQEVENIASKEVPVLGTIGKSRQDIVK